MSIVLVLDIGLVFTDASCVFSPKCGLRYNYSITKICSVGPLHLLDLKRRFFHPSSLTLGASGGCFDLGVVLEDKPTFSTLRRGNH